MGKHGEKWNGVGQLRSCRNGDEHALFSQEENCYGLICGQINEMRWSVDIRHPCERNFPMLLDDITQVIKKRLAKATMNDRSQVLPTNTRKS